MEPAHVENNDSNNNNNKFLQTLKHPQQLCIQAMFRLEDPSLSQATKHVKQAPKNDRIYTQDRRE